MAGEVPKLEGFTENGRESPHLDVLEYLKAGIDCNADEVFSSLAGFNSSPSSFDLLTPLPSYTSCSTFKGGCNQEPDFSALLFDPKVEQGESTLVDGALCEELITFDEFDAEITKDSFLLFGSVDDESLISSFLSSSSMNLPYLQGSNLPSTINIPPLNMYGPHGSFFAGESGGIAEPDDQTLIGLENCPGVPISLSYTNSVVECGTQWEALQPNTAQHHTSQCDTCHILRRIIHSNGVQDTKLEIHGCDGQRYHAVLHTQFCIDDGIPTTLEQQMVEFPVGNAEYVKQFLLQYSLLRRKEGFLLRHDSFSPAIDAAPAFGFPADCMMNPPVACLPKQSGLENSNNSCTYGKAAMGQSKLQRSSVESADHAETSGAPVKPSKSNAAAQRERTGKLKMCDLAQHFHLPINAAAKELGICPTVLKKICRRNGMRRWPHRKVISGVSLPRPRR
ncbi:hypothetical protein O6H91_08G004200 [Diphasiastrum complanatum]|uniref:Uncharacterized protein n=1 Tax=Diphasiastrum complanatum TaxID=34168 RepID=A0ACC2CVD0_DIPCM|nr:hypothetical protein O6H91_08G004200 [Diphasiastrum complanatum]